MVLRIARAWLAPCLVGAALLATACGPSSYRDFRDEVATSTCNRARRCGRVGVADRALCPVGTTLAIFHDTAQDRATASAIDVAGSIDSGRMRYDSVNAQDCLDEVAGGPCDDALAAPRRLAACNAVIGPHTETDRACWSDLECTGGVCLRVAGCAGFCGAYASPNAPCTDDPTTPLVGRCDPTVAFCGTPVDAAAGTPSTCQRRKPAGNACTETRDCVSTLVCRLHVCVDAAVVKIGQPCGGQDPCDDGNYCDPMTRLCATKVDRGASCNSEDACKDGLACIGLVAAGGAGTCGDWLDVGMPCAMTGTSGCPTTSQACVNGVCTQTQNVAGERESCAARPCGEGMACDRRQLCDYQLAIFGDCGGDRGQLCEGGLVCNATGTDDFDRPGICFPERPPACFPPST